MEQYAKLVDQLSSPSAEATATRHAWGIKTAKELRTKANAFKDKIWQCLKLAEKDGITDRDGNYLFSRLRGAFVHDEVSGLAAEMRYAFMSSALEKQYSAERDASQKALSDLRYPVEWFPATRTIRRKIHLHVGPTNSGKTYHALQRLEAADSGIYAGPLRLLAHEVYTRLNAKGKPCALITGEERRVPENMEATMSSCTVEMVPLNSVVDVAVIDEIQMLGDIDRGWAWTQAFLGIMAKEVHLCGELRTVPLVKELCALTGDKLEIHEYSRLSPLRVATNSLDGDLKKLQKGDALILFSRVQIHAMKNAVEKETGRRCAVVYGSLPPETRAQQANLFNDPDNDYDFLVASDAVGMGLNLSIKRVIFESTFKFDGTEYRQLDIPNLKQIAGRAGRYRTALDAMQKQPIDLTDGEPADIQPPLQLPDTRRTTPAENVGYVTTLDVLDLPTVRSALSTEAEPLKKAGVLPPSDILTRFASYFPPTTPFSYILIRLQDISTLGSCFKLCRLGEQIPIADLIQPYRLAIKDRITFTASPASIRDKGMPKVVQELAKCVAERSSGHILELESMKLELLGENPHDFRGGREEYLREIETLHKAIGLYLWLSYRIPGAFPSQALAFHIKEMVEKKIDECLDSTEWDAAQRERRRQKRLKLAEAASKESRPSDRTKEVLELDDEEKMQIIGTGHVTMMDMDTDHAVAALPGGCKIRP